MVTFIRRFITDREERLLTGGMVVIAANAGGAWTPIGDVTTTMLWIGGQVSAVPLMYTLLLPSLACFAVSTWYISRQFNGNFDPPAQIEGRDDEVAPMGRTIFYLGLASLIFVPIFRYFTGLPPFMGILFGLSIMWLVTDLGHRNTKREDLSMFHTLSRIDFSVLFFFLGILLCVSALDAAGLLTRLAHGFDAIFPSLDIIAIVIGVVSAIVDNVPLVAASMGMYDFSRVPADDPFWHLVAYCAGTGGSLLIIGSAAGVAFMSLEKVNFMWFLKKISFAALLGYIAGIAVFQMI
jgi:Na+/H+ antiporter NhaD/arsenite permease-like protein